MIKIDISELQKYIRIKLDMLEVYKDKIRMNILE